MDRLKSGVRGFDDLINDGFPKGFAVLLSGSPGTGKTIFGLHFLYEGLKNGEKCAYITYSQPSKDIVDQATEFGWDIKKIEFITVKPEDFRESLDGKRFDRLVLDSLSSVAVMTRDSLTDFINRLKAMGCTSIFISELQKDSKWFSRDTISEFLCDGVIILRSIEAAGEVKNLLKVEKMRSSKIDKNSHIYNIGDTGFELKVYKMK